MNKTIFLAGGCFWGVEKYLSLLPGVVNTEVGYANGRGVPTYHEVCYNNTGHAETVKVIYDAARLPLKELLRRFFEAIDPTAVNRQGNDAGVQYRTGIYYTQPEDAPVIHTALEELQKQYHVPIAVEAGLLENYTPAESYHQNYLEKNPGLYCHIPPQLLERATAPVEIPAPDALRQRLTPLQYHVTQENGTEPPFSNAYCDVFEDGIYIDIVSGQPLFASTDKFESGCGWPSFSKPIDQTAIQTLPDYSHGIHRTEVRSSGSDSHLGHVFEDGPANLGGLRYCINSAALRFIPKKEMEAAGYGAYLPLLQTRPAKK